MRSLYGTNVINNGRRCKVHILAFVWSYPNVDDIPVDQALSFSQQASNSLLIITFKTWARHYGVQQNVLFLAVKHYAANRLYRALLIWRLRLRAKLKMSRQANMARKYFVEREAWDRWRFAVEEKRRKRKFQFLEGERIKRSFLRMWI